MPELNPSQRAAVAHVGGPLLVLAGAGSGKTRVITHKIAHLIRARGIAPGHIAAVTFTNKAAREMKDRVRRLLGDADLEGLRVSTFHALGLNVMRREHEVLGYRAGFTIFDTADTLGLLRELLRKDNGGGDAEEALRRRISRWKNGFVSPREALQA
nr:UvrD-helicase domain-containing protein [Gammaproteobacteria bacterium]NIR98242.1 UvrD-helicase domain-containing protein [Gammaproteobacteria bacterium]NIT63913.1 UvrD-helicase domain-containing protein [Gammaproteobacteria bacterium]NIV20917.1 UvrD-helicase domain-containing protein [Gammaproteobacteria bacterium]NIY32493.1 UvrD-helicase domain-containing protein [Gammaproteobacteria bacterium]